jgi:hypothetical protein
MPQRRSRSRASGAEFRGGGAARHWGDDPDAMQRQALLEALTSDEMLRGEMPLSPGSVLGVARRVPAWLRRLRRGLTPKTGASTAPTENVLQKTVLSDEPAQVSRRGFLTDPIQLIADNRGSLTALGRPKNVGQQDADVEIGEGLMVDMPIMSNSPERAGGFVRLVVPEGGSSILSDILESDFKQVGGLEDVLQNRGGLDPESYFTTSPQLEKALQTSDRIETALSDRPGVLGDIESTGKLWADQAIKEIAEATGKSYEEAKADVRRRREKPGPVAQAAAGVRRRFGRRRRQ